jgi:teichuronic acid biosynthesis glycosyltransferase TuaG
MTAAPTISVITPAYNAARFLPAHLESVRGQTWTDFEHVIVDDGSTDETPGILGSAAADDPRVRVLRQVNSGAHAARNAALAAATGRYVAFLDADDLWHPEKLQRQFAFMAQRGSAMSYHQYSTIDQDGRPLSDHPIWMPKQVDYRGYLRLNGTIGNLTVMIDREQMGDFRMPDMRAEDFALFLQLLKRHPAHGLFEDLAQHRVVPGSLSANKAQTIGWIWAVYREQERIGIVRSAYYMALYGARGVYKNIRHKRLQHR